METEEPYTTFRTGVAGTDFLFCLSGAMDEFEPTESYSRIFVFNERDPPPWGILGELEHVVPSVCVWRDPQGTRRIFAGVTENGQAVFFDPNGTVQEQIADAGLHHPAAKGYGYLNDLQQIGDRLYACGFSGQVYRRNGSNAWVHMDEGILQQPGLKEGEYFVQVINGPHERAIYIAGSQNLAGNPPRADFWDGEKWRQLELPPGTGYITSIFIESEEIIWMCGAKGTLLKGNAHAGFVAMGPLGAQQLLYSVTKFRDLYYVGTNLGLFSIDMTKPNRIFHKVRTSLKPELTDANIVQSVDDVLWSIGSKDIARFDGKRWQRFEHPDNGPIGDAAADASS